MSVELLEDPAVAEMRDWPAEAKLILSALEVGDHGLQNRRRLDRIPFRTRALLSLHSDGTQTVPRILYTRDLHCRGMGFITPDRLPLGHGGIVEVAAVDGRTLRIACTLCRCREAVRGWYEGALHFNREQDWPKSHP